jgi:hypothetical protein
MVVDEKKEKKGEDSFFSSAHTASDLEPWLVLRAYVTAPDSTGYHLAILLGSEYDKDLEHLMNF